MTKHSQARAVASKSSQAWPRAFPVRELVCGINCFSEMRTYHNEFPLGKDFVLSEERSSFLSQATLLWRRRRALRSLQPLRVSDFRLSLGPNELVVVVVFSLINGNLKPNSKQKSDRLEAQLIAATYEERTRVLLVSGGVFNFTEVIASIRLILCFQPGAKICDAPSDQPRQQHLQEF